MKKMILAVIAVIMTIGTASAQQYMYVWKTDGTYVSFSVSEVDSVGFYLPNNIGGIGSIGVFSVSASKQVTFSPGNLQYNADFGSHYCADGTMKPGTWRFAKHQWDVVGIGYGQTSTNSLCYVAGTVINSDNRQVESNYSGWIDLFGWGTSGWNSGANTYMPYSYSKFYKDYYPGGNASNNLIGACANADWGVYNQIGSDAPGTWRTLTKDEWDYLRYTRADANNKFGAAIVNGVTGVILLPDNFSLPVDCSFTAGMTSGSSTSEWNKVAPTNIYSVTQWQLMEAAGAVFLPAAGQREGTSVRGTGAYGYYWSSTQDGLTGACHLNFGATGIYTVNSTYRYYGISVRLVRVL